MFARWAFAAVILCIAATPASSQERIYDGPMVLAMSWQPAFCEIVPRRPECQSQTAQRYDASHFALHGLWPGRRSGGYCGVSRQVRETDKRRRWRDLPPLGLSDEMRRALWQIMPGVQSFLHRHEWVKHGTCYSRDAETYYRHSVALMRAINATEVQELFARSVGRRLTAQAIRRAFDRAFGRGVGDRVKVSCRRDGSRMLIDELTIGLRGRVTEAPDVGALMRASRPTSPGCPGGIVDGVGLQ